MTFSMANPSNYTLIDAYSPVGDIILTVLCFLLLLILRQTFIRRSRIYNIFCTSIALLLFAAVCNTSFYYVAIHMDSDFLLILFRGLYHLSLLFIFCLYIYYMALLIHMPQRITRVVHFISVGLFFIFGSLDALSPFLRFNFYRDTSGEWIDQLHMKPFTIAYILYMFLLLLMMLFYHKRIPQKLLQVLLVTEAFCISIVFIENSFGHNSFLATSFLLPIFVILFMVHANSYSIKTGALNAGTLNSYLRQKQTEKEDVCYLCLYFDTDSAFIMPDELGKLFYNFWKGYFKKATLFHPYSNFFVLAIEHVGDTFFEESANRLIQERFLKHYDSYRIPYKILALEQPKPCGNVDQLNDIFHYFADSMELNTCRFCHRDEYQAYIDMLFITEQLKDIAKQANPADERVLVYCQPVQNVATHTFDTAEALMRLKLDGMGIIYPDRFIPIAEKNGSIHALSMILLHKTCREIHRLRQDGYDFARISINLSITELSKPDFIEEFSSTIRSYEVPYEMIAVELTESRNDTEYGIVSDRVEHFKQLGICTYLDDFGTGYSNFDRILRLKLDVVKFDRSLVVTATEDDEAHFLLNYFSGAFEELGYKVLYEGVETPEQENMCIHNHADYLQGFRFSKPIPIEELHGFLRKKEINLIHI